MGGGGASFSPPSFAEASAGFAGLLVKRAEARAPASADARAGAALCGRLREPGAGGVGSAPRGSFQIK